MMRTTTTAATILLSILVVVCFNGCCPVTAKATTTMLTTNNSDMKKQLHLPKRALQQSSSRGLQENAVPNDTNSDGEYPNYSCDEREDLYCQYKNNDVCDSTAGRIYEGESETIPAMPGCENSDCLDCDYMCNGFVFDCESCYKHGCYYCPGDGTCYNSPFYTFSDDVYTSCKATSSADVSDYIHFTTTASCSAYNKKQNNAYNDPLYSINKWIYTMIDVERVWKQLKITGNNIHVRINDGGIDSHHPEFGNRFDHEHSCSSTDGGAGYDIFGNEGAENGYDDEIGYLPDENDDYYYDNIDSHGTATAAIVGGEANNGICGVGIAPGVTLSGCNVFDHHGNYWEDNVSTVDISQNSYGSSACILKDSDDYDDDGIVDDNTDDSVRKRILQESSSSYPCPFTYENEYGTYPCNACGTNFNPQYFSPTNTCKETIIQHCSYFYEQDQDGCIEFLDLFIDDGTCEYNILHTSEREQMVSGITRGRNGKGIIYVFASGNDFAAGADTNMEGYLNSRFTISVGAVGKDTKHASYSTPGANLFIVAPGGDAESITNHVTAYAGGGCYEAGLGTSYACPVATGVIALILEANPNLSWRDVQGVLAASSRMVDKDIHPNDDTLITNAAGFTHSNYYGFGIVNAYAAVLASQSWIPYGPEHMFIGESGVLNIPIADDMSSKVLSTITLDATTNGIAAQFRQNQVDVPERLQFFTESVVIYLHVRHLSRGDLQVVLKSPAGTVSTLHPGNRPESTQLEGDERWKLLTVRSWGETPFGGWKLSIADTNPGHLHDCVDAPWTITNNRGRRIDCDYFENKGYCIDGVVNIQEAQSQGDQYLLEKDDNDEGIPATEACCVCGGGRSESNGFENVLIEWQLVVYGHYYLEEDGVPIVNVPTPPAPVPTSPPIPVEFGSPSSPTTSGGGGLVGPTVFNETTTETPSVATPFPTRGSSAAGGGANNGRRSSLLIATSIAMVIISVTSLTGWL